MPGHDIIVIGACAGRVEVLIDSVREIPADLPAAVFVVVHGPPNSATMLPAVLNRARALPSAHASPQEPIRKGHIYVTPIGIHILAKDRGNGRCELGRGPK